MIKKNKNKRKWEAEIQDNFSKAYEVVAKPPHYVMEVALKTEQNNLNMYKSEIVYGKNEIERYELVVVKATKAVEQSESNVATLKEELKKVDTKEYDEKIAVLFRSLRKISDLKSIEITDTQLKFTTMPLFTRIRQSDGSRIHRRRCIGAFKVDMQWSGTSLYIQNISFSGMRGHWAVNGTARVQACLGGWQTELVNILRKKDIVGFINMVIMYLKDTDDGSAYTRSHNWVEDRNNHLAGVSRFAVGDYVCTVRANYFNEGTRSRISEIHPENPMYYKVNGVKNLSGAVGTTSSNWIEATDFAKISEATYNKTNIERTYRSMMERAINARDKKTGKTKAIDVLPDGTSNDELLALINK